MFEACWILSLPAVLRDFARPSHHGVHQAGGVDLPADYKGTTEFALRPPYSRVQTEYYGVGANQKGGLLA